MSMVSSPLCFLVPAMCSSVYPCLVLLFCVPVSPPLTCSPLLVCLLFGVLFLPPFGVWCSVFYSFLLLVFGVWCSVFLPPFGVWCLVFYSFLLPPFGVWCSVFLPPFGVW